MDTNLEGYKESEGKIDYSEINWEYIDAMAGRMMKNKGKYPKHNFKKVLDKEELLQATFRHLRKILQPIDNDEETIEEHLAAIGCNCAMMHYQITHNSKN